MSWIGATAYRLRSRIRETRIKSAFRKGIEKHPPIIVYQMGKVASTSIYNSLKEFYPGITIHRHILSEPNDWQAEALLEHTLTHQKPLKIISLVREPVSRNISAFFQNFELITGIPPAKSKLSLKEIKEIILSDAQMDNKVPLWWFEENIKKHFGIDVFAQPFDKDKGWARITNNNIDLLLIKTEVKDEVKTKAIQEFISLPHFKLSASNVSEDKEYAALYSAFKKEIKLPRSYIEMLHNASQVRHFYTEEELKSSSKKWEENEGSVQ